MTIAKQIAGLAFALGLSAAAPAGAEPARAVVELFTSQGCSSCPPADALLDTLAGREGMIALSYHVDYWDYLGWKDTLASPANTERQKAYARALGARSVYTPQAVVNGRDHVNGAKQSKVDATINRMSAGPEALSVEVRVRRDGDTIVIEAGGPTEGQASKAEILLVYFTPVASVTPAKGENAGRTITYRNAVSMIQAVGMWKGRQGRWEIPIAEIGRHGGGGCAVLLQSMKGGVPGPILGAAMLER